MYIRCIYDILGRNSIKYTGIYGVYVQFWPTATSLHFSKKGAGAQVLKVLKVREKCVLATATSHLPPAYILPPVLPTATCLYSANCLYLQLPPPFVSTKKRAEQHEMTSHLRIPSTQYVCS